MIKAETIYRYAAPVLAHLNSSIDQFGPSEGEIITVLRYVRENLFDSGLNPHGDKDIKHILANESSWNSLYLALGLPIYIYISSLRLQVLLALYLENQLEISELFGRDNVKSVGYKDEVTCVDDFKYFRRRFQIQPIDKFPPLTPELLDYYLPSIVTSISQQSGIAFQEFQSDRKPGTTKYPVLIGQRTYNISWDWLYKKGFCVLMGLDMAEVRKHLGIACRTIVEWATSGERPDTELLATMIGLREQLKSHEIELTLEILDTHLRSMLDAIAQQSKIPVNKFTSEAPDGTKFLIPVAGKNCWISWPQIYRDTFRLITGIYPTTKPSIPANAVLEWYVSGIRPTKTSLLQQVREKEEEREQRLELTLEILDEYLVSMVDAISQQSGITVDDFSTSTPAEDAVFTVRIAGKDYRIKWLWLYKNCFALLVGIPVGNAQSKIAVDALLEWYKTRKRPDRGKLLAKMEAREKAISTMNEIDLEFLDQHLVTMLDSIATQSKIPVAEFTSGKPGHKKYPVSIVGKIYPISWQWLYKRVFCMITGFGTGVVRKHFGIAVGIMLEWYRSGTRPQKEQVLIQVEEHEQAIQRKPEFTRTFFERHLVTIINDISRQSGIPVGKFNTRTPSRDQVFEVLIDGKPFDISWSMVHTNFLAIYGGISITMTEKSHRLSAVKRTLQSYRGEHPERIIDSNQQQLHALVGKKRKLTIRCGELQFEETVIFQPHVGVKDNMITFSVTVPGEALFECSIPNLSFINESGQGNSGKIKITF